MFIVPISRIDSIASLEGMERTAKLAESAGSKVPFADMLSKSIQELEASEAVSEQDALNMAMGDGGDLHTAMINSAILSTAVKTTVQLTSRAISSYKEIMQMQI